MIEALVLPVFPASLQYLIHPRSCESLPASALLAKLSQRGKLHKQMNMVWHDHKISQHIPVVVKEQQRVIVEAIGKQEKVEVSDAELEKKLEELAEEGGQALSTVRKHYRDEEERRGLVGRVRERKTIEFLKSQATYS